MQDKYQATYLFPRLPSNHALFNPPVNTPMLTGVAALSVRSIKHLVRCKSYLTGMTPRQIPSPGIGVIRSDERGIWWIRGGD